MTQFCRVVALQNGQKVELVVVPEADLAAVKAKGVTGQFPMLETPEGNINESVAIAKFLAHGSATLLGTNNLERAQVDQWCYWFISKV